MSRPAALFVGSHPALDFLNSTSTPSGVRTEWLRNGAGLVDWSEGAGLIDRPTAMIFRAKGADPGALDAVAERARSVREWLRAVVERHAGSPLGADVVDELVLLNHLLAQDESCWQVEAGGRDASGGDGLDRHPLRRRRVRRWTAPEQLLQPIAEAIGDLLCRADFRLIRACEATACTLMFLDGTKAHARRWCSMAVCGNRAKAAAHRARMR